MTYQFVRTNLNGLCGSKITNCFNLVLLHFSYFVDLSNDFEAYMQMPDIHQTLKACIQNTYDLESVVYQFGLVQERYITFKFICHNHILTLIPQSVECLYHQKFVT